MTRGTLCISILQNFVIFMLIKWMWLSQFFSSFGGVSNFYGKVTTVKCFENNGLIAEILEENGEGRVLVVDGGGAVRRALIDAELAQLAADNDWAGIIVYGAVRQIQQLENIDIGIHALVSNSSWCR